MYTHGFKVNYDIAKFSGAICPHDSHMPSAQNNHLNLVGHLSKIRRYCRLSMVSVLEVYSKICPTKLDLVGIYQSGSENDP